jgi:hypothetical protein
MPITVLCRLVSGLRQGKVGGSLVEALTACEHELALLSDFGLQDVGEGSACLTVRGECGEGGG